MHLHLFHSLSFKVKDLFEFKSIKVRLKELDRLKLAYKQTMMNTIHFNHGKQPWTKRFEFHDQIISKLVHYRKTNFVHM